MKPEPANPPPAWLTRAQLVGRDILANAPISIVDVGAAGAPPPNQAHLASVATYLGFDPDLRSPQTGNAFGFQKYSLLNRAISAQTRDHITFHLTKYPECSSVLTPDHDETHRYAIGEFFDVVGQSEVPAITLNAALEQAGLSRVDWLKLDTQGTDHDLLTSLDRQHFDRLLVVDVEPGVTAFYHGENSVTALHEHMLKNGFWLADLSPQRFPRLSVATIEALKLDRATIDLLDRNPFALELRYCRTVEFLEAQSFTARDFFALWLIAMANGHTAFAVEIATSLARRGWSAEQCQQLVTITLDHCRTSVAKPSLVSRLSQLLLPPLVLKLGRRLRRRFQRN